MIALLFLVQLVACAGMLGIVWIVQLSTYPLFAKIGAEHFQAYHRAYTGSVVFVILPLMLLELGSCAAIFWLQPSFWNGVSGGLLGVIWASTFFIQVPLHNRLEQGFDEKLGRKLVRTNWIRTVAWTARIGILGWQLLSTLS